MELRKPTEKEKEEFDEIDKKLDSDKQEARNKFIKKEKKAHIELRNKIFMKISDVEPNDARWFKEFCDRNTDGKQFLGIKVIRQVMERLDPFLKNVLVQINNLNERTATIEAILAQPQEDKEEDQKTAIPRQGGYHKNRGTRK